jgi:hypothetical protein
MSLLLERKIDNFTKRYKGSITRLIYGQNQLERVDAISNLQNGV